MSSELFHDRLDNNMKQPIITISSLPGSGSSTIANNVAEKLKWDLFSSGDFAREIAHERNLTLAELTQKAENNPEIDRMIDAKNKSLTNAKEVVVDSRLAFHFIPNSFDVYLDVTLQEAAQRIYRDESESREKSGEIHDTIEEVREHIQERVDSDRERYKDLYDLDYTSHDHYDLVVDTTDKKIPSITKTVISEYKNWNS